VVAATATTDPVAEVMAGSRANLTTLHLLTIFPRPGRAPFPTGPIFISTGEAVLATRNDCRATGFAVLRF